MWDDNGQDNRPKPDPRALAFVTARRAATALADYPGAPPQSLDEAYRIQNDAIGLWPTAIAGWKVGRITGEAAQRLGADRLSGPVFKERVVTASGKTIDMPVFADGFAAVEAECILVVGADAPADKFDWTIDEAREMVSTVRLGVEIASSPFPGINDAGSLVTISDFGNNHGLILGEPLPGWHSFPLADWKMQTIIDGAEAGSAAPDSIPGGPLESFRFLLENTARRGLLLKSGMLISSGAVTGVHEVEIGQHAIVRMAGLADIAVRFVAAQPLDE